MREKPSFFSRLFGAITGTVGFLYKLLVLMLVAGIAVVFIASLRGGKPVSIEDNLALVLAPTGALVEQIDRDPGTAFFEELAGEPAAQTRVSDVVDAIDAATTDARITLAILKLDGLWSAGLPQLQEITAALARFRAAGKRVIAYGPWYDQSHFYAAAQADEIVLDPMGLVTIEGYSSYQSYFKDALDKLGVEMNVFRVGEYKSAVEPFTRNDMSAEAKAANLEWLGDLWRLYGEGVSRGRALQPQAVGDYVSGFADNLQANGGDGARYALDSGLVTHLETLSAFRARVGAVVGFDDSHGSFRQIHFQNYLRGVQQEQARSEKTPPTQVALVVVQGEIVDGASDIGLAGGDTISELLDEARRDKNVAAVVLRVDSPGGSVWASEQIRREVQRLRAEGKPVVASMGTVAASGGYWVSMDADQIWAQDSTVTGSIGIFGLLPTLQKPLAKMGIYSDGVGTTELAGTGRLDRPLTPQWASIFQSLINKGYRDFIEGVAAARKMPVDKVNEIARGRVWSGEDAQALGLVDQLGGLAQAADAAAELAKLEPDTWTLQEFSPSQDFASQLLSRFSGGVQLSGIPGMGMISAQMRDWLARGDVARVLRTLNDPNSLYAHCWCGPDRAGRAR